MLLKDMPINYEGFFWKGHTLMPDSKIICSPLEVGMRLRGPLVKIKRVSDSTFEVITRCDLNTRTISEIEYTSF